MLKKLTYILILALIIIQFFPPSKNDSGDEKNNISTKYTVPQKIKAILQTACNDCHSNLTSYPWYTNIQPVGWWLQHHVNEGKTELNFSEFATYSDKKAAHKMEEVAEMLDKDEMPLPSYLWIHHDAKLSVDDKALLREWAVKLQQEIKG
ncbi:MAG: heme-binding domain-containing protein [Saprospiraceae bacterium]|jgi:hypothetical protein|uniref:heme-binding domain-containing protein n=1 Tax=Candidatus Brachybacter algidus TaxID=2982024 RepID=UPI001B5172C4|nr:heme-binding domain-containing protein [Candidatus Brachybacter algidus]MBP7305372.1 heme-binding domain-containing protein [Saprospiraceae bacterium]MBK6372271.1 heme-binding domain-containing protein [Candidatus Brachybacter algidus]MBK6447482.1 heme-binding domain-containing protein [Candidatus Brachybacter algidus]MBK7603318.1 heme-binding domain-containing protein [Candidatus Brachybacter algidus]MBK8356724.1 heme-binding domain-containing protein [Candidatus Brachybacter algidus]